MVYFPQDFACRCSDPRRALQVISTSDGFSGIAGVEYISDFVTISIINSLEVGTLVPLTMTQLLDYGYYSGSAAAGRQLFKNTI